METYVKVRTGTIKNRTNSSKDRTKKRDSLSPILCNIALEKVIRGNGHKTS